MEEFIATARVHLVKWGNSLAVRIPKTALEELRVKEGDELRIRIKNGRLELAPMAHEETLESLVARITPENRHGELDWGLPVGRRYGDQRLRSRDRPPDED